MLNVAWDSGELSGRSGVVANDRYELALRVPAGWRIRDAAFDGKTAEHTTEGELVRVSITPEKTGEVDWKILFVKD